MHPSSNCFPIFKHWKFNTVTEPKIVCATTRFVSYEILSRVYLQIVTFNILLEGIKYFYFSAIVPKRFIDQKNDEQAMSF